MPGAPWLAKRPRSNGGSGKKRSSKKAKKAPAKDVKDEPFVVERPVEHLATSAEVVRRLASVPRRLRDALYAFQLQGLQFCIERGARVLIADEMGLGKTIQAIATACAYRESWPVLVVVPAVVKLNWAEEIERWVDDLEPGEIHVVRGMKDVDAWGTAHGVKWVIVTYGLFRNSSAVALRIKEAAFDFVIVDESHYLKSHDAIRTTLIGPIVRDAQHALLLSGTPALARPAELYPQVSSLRTNAFGSWSQYTKFFCNAKRGRFGWDTKGASNLDELSARLAPMMLRRKKNEVLTELPPKVKRRIAIDLAPKAAKEIAASMEALRKVGALSRFLDDGGAGAASASDRDARSVRNEHLGLLTETFQVNLFYLPLHRVRILLTI